MPRHFHSLRPVESLDYGRLISQVLQVCRNARTIDALVEFLGPTRFADTTEHPTSQYLAMEDPLPPEFVEKVFFFDPGRGMSGVADFVVLTAEGSHDRLGNGRGASSANCGCQPNRRARPGLDWRLD
jgi:hypothetical protein